MNRTAPILLATLVTMGAVRADAQTVRALAEDRVTVKAEEIALGDLVGQLAALSTLKFIALDAPDRAVRVSVEAEDIAPLDAVVLALKASGLDYAMTGTRLIVGRAKKALENGGPVDWVEASRNEQPLPPAPPAESPDSAAPVFSMDHSAPQYVSGTALPTFTSDDEFGRNLGLEVGTVPFVVREDSATVTIPGFVPYKLRPEVKKLRRFSNIADIP